MKNNLLSLIAAFVLTSSAYAKEEVKNIDVNSACPILNIENKTQDEIDLAKGLMIGLKSVSNNVYTVIEDITKQYNKTDNVEKYINEQNLKNIGVTHIYGALIGLLYLKPLNGDKLYKEIIGTIDAKNPNWCEAESYQHLIDKYALFAEKEKSTHKEKE
mgnify:CR=1 FL=1